MGNKTFDKPHAVGGQVQRLVRQKFHSTFFFLSSGLLNYLIQNANSQFKM